MRANNLRSSRIYAGTTLRIPGQGVSLQQHRVRRGENLTVIARRYRMTVEELKRVNQLSQNRIYIGQVLKVNSPQGG